MLMTGPDVPQLAFKDTRSPSLDRRVVPVGKVLLIEDELDLSAALTTRLLHHGYEVRQAYDGLSGLADMARYGPDVAILDIRLPVLSGYELLHRVRAMPHAERVPILLITGDTDPLLDEKACRWGVQGVLRKPFQHQELVKAVRDLMRS